MEAAQGKEGLLWWQCCLASLFVYQIRLATQGWSLVCNTRLVAELHHFPGHRMGLTLSCLEGTGHEFMLQGGHCLSMESPMLWITGRAQLLHSTLCWAQAVVLLVYHKRADLCKGFAFEENKTKQNKLYCKPYCESLTYVQVRWPCGVIFRYLRSIWFILVAKNRIGEMVPNTCSALPVSLAKLFGPCCFQKKVLYLTHHANISH